MWNVTMCFQMKPDTDTQFCQRKYNSHESKAGESKWSVCICTRRNEGLETRLKGNALPGMLEARGERHGETLGYGSLNPYLRVMLGAALTLPQKSAQNERTPSLSKILVMKPSSKWSGRVLNVECVLISLLKGSQVKVLPSKSGHLNSIPGASTEEGESKFSQAVLWPSYKHCIVVLCFVGMGVYANTYTWT